MSDALRCSKCDSELIEGAKFCPSCGAEQITPEVPEEPAEPTVVTCAECGTELSENQAFCHVCGKKNAPVKANGSSRKVTILAWLRRSLTLFVAILFMAFAFLPIVTCSDIDIGGIKIEADTGFSAIESVIYCVDSLTMLDPDELLDSDIYEELSDAAVDQFADDVEISKFVKLSIRLALQSDESFFTPQYVLVILLSVLYILFAAAYLIVAVIDFILFAIDRKSDKLGKATLIMLAAIPPLALITAIVCLLGFGFSSIGTTVSGAVIAIIAISLAVLAYFSVEHFFLGEEMVKFSVTGIIKRTLSTVACVLLIFSAFMPVFSYQAKTVFKGATAPSRASRDFGIDFFCDGNFTFSDADVERYENITSNEVATYTKSYSGYARRDFQKGTTFILDTKIIIDAFACFGAYEFAPVFLLVTLFSLLASLSGAVLLWQNIVALTGNSSPRKALTIPFKVIGVIAAVIALALVIVFLAIAGHNVSAIEFQNASLSLAIAPGIIMAVIFAVMAASVPMGKRKR